MLGVAQRKNLFAPSAHLTFPLFPREKSGGKGKRVGTGRISSLALAAVHRYIFGGKLGNIYFWSLGEGGEGRSFGTKTAAPVSAPVAEPYITSLKRKRRRRRRAKRFLLHSSLPKGKRRRKTVP